MNNNYSFIHEQNPTGQCLFTHICLSNTCLIQQKLTCEECKSIMHEKHINNVISYQYFCLQI